MRVRLGVRAWELGVGVGGVFRLVVILLVVVVPALVVSLSRRSLVELWSGGSMSILLSIMLPVRLEQKPGCEMLMALLMRDVELRSSSRPPALNFGLKCDAVNES